MAAELQSFDGNRKQPDDDGNMGRIETDGLHVFTEDHQGTCWWHRWDSAFPRSRRP